MNGNLINQIRNNLRNIGLNSPVLINPTAPDKLYEIFIFTCVVRALRRIGASSIEARDSNDMPTNNLIFRLGPGRIYAPFSAPGFIYFWYNNNEYEIQNGLRVLGRSHVLHELDICIIQRDEAIRCRTNQIDPVKKGIIFLAECKYYGTSLPLHLGREYLGLSSEFNIRVKTIISNSSSDEIHNLVTSHRGTENFNVSPSEPNNVDTFIHWLANELRQVL